MKPLPTDIRVPRLLLRAARTQAGYMAAHRHYARRYDVNDTHAYRLLERDLAAYELPGRYSSVRSFWVARRKAKRS